MSAIRLINLGIAGLLLVFVIAPTKSQAQNDPKITKSQSEALRTQTIASLRETFRWCESKEKLLPFVDQLGKASDSQFPLQYIDLLKRLSSEKRYQKITCLGEIDSQIPLKIFLIFKSQENIAKYLVPFFARDEVVKAFIKLPIERMGSDIVAALGRSFPKDHSLRKKYLMMAFKDLKELRQSNFSNFTEEDNKLLKSIGEELKIKTHDYVKVAERPYGEGDCGVGRIHDVYVPKEFVDKFKDDKACKIALQLFQLVYGEEGHHILYVEEPYFLRNKKKIADLVDSKNFSQNIDKLINLKDKKNYIDFMRGVRKDFPLSSILFEDQVWEACGSKYNMIVDVHESSCE